MSKIKKIAICILASICAALSCASLATVLARYVSEKGGFGLIGDGGANDLPYEISSPVVVNTQEELFEALQYGYSYVMLGDNLKNPFVVTEEVTNMSRSLILDINGKQIQRNSRDPMLTIPVGITLTILDSSVGKTGGLYNPVGSVLKIDGGTLTATGGKFESGPRPTEYYSYFTNTTNITNGVKNRIGESNTTQFTVSKKGATEGATETETKIMPVFTPVITKNGEVVEHVDGNVYFDVDWKDGNGNVAIPADTYCYYITSDGFSTGDTIDFSATDADFSYTYYAKPGTYEYISSTVPAGDKNVNYVEVTIYAYKDDIKTAAEGTDGNAPNYASVKMVSGELNINVNSTNPDAGSFYTYFGVEQASCIYTKGGTMNINTTGTFSTVDPAVVSKINQNGLAAKGEDICIRTTTDNTGVLNIRAGTFRSYVGDIVDMYGGEINVYGGLFEKDALANSRIHLSDLTNVLENTQHGTNGACIDSHGGVINVEGKDANNKISFIMRGSGVSCISTTRVEKDVTPEVKCTNCIFTIDSTADFNREVTAINNVGVYNREGEVTLNNCEFTMNGYNALGIVSSDSSVSGTSGKGKIKADNVQFLMGGDKARGIYQKSGTTTLTTGIFSMTGYAATGIVASAGEVNIGNPPTQNTFRAESELGVPEGAVFFYIDRCYDCYGIKAGKNNSILGDNVGTIPDDSAVTINLNSCQVLLGQGINPSTHNLYYQDTLKAMQDAGKVMEVGEVVCAGIYSNLKNAQINVKRAHFVISGAYSAAIHAQKGTVTQTAAQASDGNYYGKLSALVGSRYVDYVNGGKESQDGNQNWIYSHVSENVFNVDDFEIKSKTYNLESTTVKSSFGIMSAGGNVTLDRTFIRLKGAYSSGIYSTGGTVTINQQLQELIVDETPEDESGVRKQISTTAIFVTDGTDAAGNPVRGKVVIGGSGNNIKNGYTVAHDGTTEVLHGGIGIVVNSSSVSSGSKAAENSLEIKGDLTVSCSESTAVLVSGGSVDIAENAKFDVTSYIASIGNDNLTCLDYVCEFVNESEREKIKQNYAGVKITGGTLTCEGTLNIAHHGLCNDEYADITDFATFAVKSFALNVEANVGDVVKIASGEITNTCGGGVAVSGGKLYLGVKDNNSKNVNVTTTGEEYYTVRHIDSNSGGWKDNSNWGYYIMKTGGYAVSVRGGDVEVDGGEYVTNLGSAFVVKEGNAIINSGKFYTYDTATDINNTIGAGPAAHYSLAMYGGDLTVNGGTFGTDDGGRAGIMLRGIHGEGHTSENSVVKNATLKLNKGTVLSNNNAAGICLFEHAHVTLGAENGNDSDVQVTAGSSAITVESSNYCSDTTKESDTQLTVNCGIYKAMRKEYSIWQNAIYDAMAGATIRIKGGHFYCEYSLCITFNTAAPTDFKISGGTFERGSAGNLFHSSGDVQLSQILADGYDLYITDVAVDKTTLISGISGQKAEIRTAETPTEPEQPTA